MTYGTFANDPISSMILQMRLVCGRGVSSFLAWLDVKSKEKASLGEAGPVQIECITLASVPDREPAPVL